MIAAKTAGGSDVGPPGSFKAIVSPQKEVKFDFGGMTLMSVYSITSY
jgi:hypothetical protein